jgi:hypothetical protein
MRSLKIEYPASTGRNLDEIIVASVTDEAAREKYPEGCKTVRPHLRLVPQPRT